MKGYELSKGKYVLVDPEDLEAAAPRQTRTIDIEDFVELADIDPVYYSATYYVAPRGNGADKAYALLREAMAKTGRAAVGRFVMRTRQYLAVVRAADDKLVLETLYFADEIRSTKELEVPKRVSVGAKEPKVAQQLIDSLTTEWDPKRYGHVPRRGRQDHRAQGGGPTHHGGGTGGAAGGGARPGRRPAGESRRAQAGETGPEVDASGAQA